MPGLLVDVAVKPGQKVQAGERLAVIEAMKMENILVAPQRRHGGEAAGQRKGEPGGGPADPQLSIRVPHKTQRCVPGLKSCVSNIEAATALHRLRPRFQQHPQVPAQRLRRSPSRWRRSRSRRRAGMDKARRPVAGIAGDAAAVVSATPAARRGLHRRPGAHRATAGDKITLLSNVNYGRAKVDGVIRTSATDKWGGSGQYA